MDLTPNRVSRADETRVSFDMMTKYEETARGGLAVTIVEC